MEFTCLRLRVKCLGGQGVEGVGARMSRGLVLPLWLRLVETHGLGGQGLGSIFAAHACLSLAAVLLLAQLAASQGLEEVFEKYRRNRELT